MFSLVKMTPSMAAGIFVATLGIVAGSAGYAQSVSDDDYLSALDTMVVDMDLEGIANQTFETQTVAAPQLADVAGQVASCDTLLAQAEETGVPIEIFGEGSTMTGEELAALSKCRMDNTGVVVSYLMPES